MGRRQQLQPQAGEAQVQLRVSQVPPLFWCEPQSMANRYMFSVPFDSKFVDSHLKPYRCKDPSCESARFSSTACLLRHEREAHAMHGHGDKPFLCSYEGCDRSLPGSGFPRQWNLRDHMRRVHNDHRLSGSPLSGNGQAQQSSKGRKRKDVPKAPAAGARKASAKPNAVEAAAQEVQSQRPLIEEWIAHRKALEDTILNLGQPEDASTNVHLIQEAQRHLSSMNQITLSIGTSQDTAGSAQALPRRTHAHD